MDLEEAPLEDLDSHYDPALNMLCVSSLKVVEAIQSMSIAILKNKIVA